MYCPEKVATKSFMPSAIHFCEPTLPATPCAEALMWCAASSEPRGKVSTVRIVSALRAPPL